MAPPILTELVDRFERNRASYQAAGYNETQVRREFLDPFFKALGWDVNNEQGHAEAYKDVIHEDAIKVGGATKAPDYCFRIGGRRIFFLEAKKPSVNVREDVSAAFQLRRYAWSAKLPLSILSDFEELAVYDCRVKPDKADKPGVGRVMLLRYDQYIERWDELSNIFSREAVLRGSFDKFAEGTKLKRGTAEVDTAFLHEIESWRELLARNFALRNPDLGQRDLNFAVQRTIDRLIFLRMCEDRGIENYGQLQALLNGESVYRRLLEIYDRADERYNSGLFHFHDEKGRAQPPDELTTALTLDDKPLKEIIRGLYFPDSPYEFSVLPAEILGQVYEQFLGKVIRLTAGHRATVEDKPEVKKAGGVTAAIRAFFDGSGPDLLGLAEISSRRLLDKLAAKLAVGYLSVWEAPELDTQTGLALLARDTAFARMQTVAVQRPARFARPRSMVVRCEMTGKTEPILVAVNHWKSRMPAEATGFRSDEIDRRETARWLGDFLAKSRRETSVIVLGDFNAEPWEPPFREVGLRAVRIFSTALSWRATPAYLYNAAWRFMMEPDFWEDASQANYQEPRPKTSHGEGEWLILDQLMVSARALSHGPIELVEKTVEFNCQDDLTSRRTNRGTLRPYGWRARADGTYAGTSDHFPILAVFRA